MPTPVLPHMARAYGLLRSVLIYHGQPAKRRRALAFYRDFLGPGDLCFDIGAHSGGRVATFARLGARVVAVEPQPLFMSVLRRLHGRRPGVTLVEAAVGESAGETTLLVSDWTPTVSTVAPDWAARVGATRSFRNVRWNRQLTVQLVTLNGLIAEHGLPRFCKIDVEGHELAVLHGLSQPIPILSFEYVNAALDDALACLDRLTALGDYRFNVSSGESLRLALPEWQSATALSHWLRQHAGEDGSGDVYARLAADLDAASKA